MFKYCIWYELKQNNTLNRIIIEIATLFKINMFRGHLTLDSFLTEQKSHELYQFYINKPLKLPTFYIVGNIYQTNTNNFFALQQNYLLLGDKNHPYLKENAILHTSIAYKYDIPFTDEEIKIAQQIIDKNRVALQIIYSSDINLSLYFCNAKYPSFWKKIK